MQTTPLNAAAAMRRTTHRRRRILTWLGMSAASLGSPAVGRTQATTSKGNDILVVYLTRTRNTEALARIVQSRTGGTLAPLVLQQPYPRDYQAHVDQVVRENETGFLPPLANSVDPAPYATVFVGFPTWGMQLPPPVKSWLARADLRGKRVLPFNTHAEFGVGTGFQTVQALCASSTVLPGLSIQGGYEKRGQTLVLQGAKAQQAERQVTQWLARSPLA